MPIITSIQPNPSASKTSILTPALCRVESIMMSRRTVVRVFLLRIFNSDLGRLGRILEDFSRALPLPMSLLSLRVGGRGVFRG